MPKTPPLPGARPPRRVPLRSPWIRLLLGGAFLVVVGRTSADDAKGLDGVRAGLKRQRDAIKSLFVRYEEEAVPLIEEDVAFRFDIMQFRMKTEEHEAFEGAKRYHRTIHRGTARALGDPTVVDPLSPKLVRERRRDRAEKYRTDNAEAKAQGYDPPPRIFLVGPLDYEAGYDGQKLWRTLNGTYYLHPLSQFPGLFRGSIVNWPGTREDYLQAVGLGVPDPTETGVKSSGEPSSLLPDALGEHRYRVLDRTEAVDGADCVVLEARWEAGDGRGEMTDRLWLDGNRGYALLRRETLRDGSLERRIVNGSFDEVAAGLWLPKSVEFQYAAFPEVPEGTWGKPLLARRLAVLELRANDPPAGLFAIKPGAKVVDLSRGGKTPEP